MLFVPQLKGFFPGTADFDAVLIDDLGSPFITIFDKENVSPNTPHLFWSVSDPSYKSAPVNEESRAYESQEIEFRFRADFPLIISVDIPLSVQRQVVEGSIDQIKCVNQLQNVIPIFNDALWNGHTAMCGAHDVTPLLLAFDDAILLQFEKKYDLFWYGKTAGILLDQNKKLVGVAYRNLSLDIKKVLLNSQSSEL